MMKKSSLVTIVFMIGLLVGVYSSPNTTDAVLRWTDDFNDGNLDGWTVHTGGFNLQNQRLEASSAISNYMSRLSPFAFGHWSFDVYTWDSSQHGGWAVHFVALDLDNPDQPRNGYYLRIDEAVYELMRRVDNVPYTMAGYWSIDAWGTNRHSVSEMFHVDIVRHYDGHMYVWLNYTGAVPETGIFFEGWDSTFNDSVYFSIYMVNNYQGLGGEETWIDNLHFDNDPDSGPPPDTEDDGQIPLVLLVTPWAIGLCLVVGGLAVWRRRQKKVDISPGEELKE